MTSESFTPQAPLQTAVLFLVFNRPDTTRQVFEAIRQARPPRLYVAADGARVGKLGEAERVDQVRKIAIDVDWPCQVKTLFRDKNLGCKKAVSSGIDWFFENEEQGIILEDDCLPSQSFFWYCQDLLNFYKDNQEISVITGTNITTDIDFSADYFFSKYALMWGWATWARAWSKYDVNLRSWPKNKQYDHLKQLGLLNDIEIFAWREILNRTANNEIDTWDYQWIYACWLNKGLTVAPAKNLVVNIGFSKDATHTTSYHPILSNLKINHMLPPLLRPSLIERHIAADAFICKNWFGIDFKTYLKGWILGIPGLAKFNSLRRIFFEKTY